MEKGRGIINYFGINAVDADGNVHELPIAFPEKDTEQMIQVAVDVQDVREVNQDLVFKLVKVKLTKGNATARCVRRFLSDCLEII